MPLQIGQFESDNRMDEDLARIVLEGGGGGQKRESYELAMYFMARHTALDSVEKRGRRGYLFLIGDEMPYPKVNPKEARRFIGDNLLRAIPTEAIIAELQRSFDVYYLMPTAAGWGGDTEILTRWRDLLGQNVLELDDLDAVCETIALTVGLGEDSIDLDEGSPTWSKWGRRTTRRSARRWLRCSAGRSCAGLRSRSAMPSRATNGCDRLHRAAPGRTGGRPGRRGPEGHS